MFSCLLDVITYENINYGLFPGRVFSFGKFHGRLFSEARYSAQHADDSSKYQWDDDPLVRETAKTIITAPITKTMNLIITDIYNVILKKGIKKLFHYIRRNNVKRKIRKTLRPWWYVICTRLRGKYRFARHAQRKLKNCFYEAGVEAYKKSVIDIGDSPSEFFFLTLMEFKNLCLLKLNGENSYVYSRFMELEKDIKFINMAKNVRSSQKQLKDLKRKKKIQQIKEGEEEEHKKEA